MASSMIEGPTSARGFREAVLRSLEVVAVRTRVQILHANGAVSIETCGEQR